MATKEMRVCDAYGTVKGITTVRVVITNVASDGRSQDAEVQLLNDLGDLSPRGINRLVRFVKRGLSSVHKEEPPAASTDALKD